MVLAKQLSKDVPSLMVLFLRCLFGVLFLLPYAAKTGWRELRPCKPSWHLLRTLFSCTAIFCTYYAYRTIPLATASAIGYSSPLFTALLAWMLLKERVTRSMWLAIVGGYIGVLLMLQPVQGGPTEGIYVALGANLAASIAIIVTKKLSQTDNTASIMLVSSIANLGVATIAALWVWELPASRDLWLLVGMGLFGTLSNTFYTQALQWEASSFVAPFEYTRLLFAAGAGILFFGELPTMGVLLGALGVIAANYWLTRAKAQSTTGATARRPSLQKE
jgi:drug/metabolite transporter (DMT)-like permease